MAIRARDVKSRSAHWSQGSKHLDSESGEGPDTAGALSCRKQRLTGGHTPCQSLDISLISAHAAGTLLASPKRCIKGKMTHKWAEKCSWSTASPGLKLAHPLGVWARQIVIDL